MEPFAQRKQQRTPKAGADLDAVVRSGLPTSGPFFFAHVSHVSLVIDPSPLLRFQLLEPSRAGIDNDAIVGFRIAVVFENLHISIRQRTILKLAPEA